MNETEHVAALEARVVELEIRSEERRAEVERLEEFVRGYEARIARLEKDHGLDFDQIH